MSTSPRRSWYKYEEEKNHQPRDLNLGTINEHDVLVRTLNEIHKCVLPEQEEYRLLKSPEELNQHSSELGEVETVEMKDPRRNPTRLMKPPFEYVRSYGYSSELNINEQKVLLTSIKMAITHNPKLIKPGKRLAHQSPLEVSKDLHEKAQLEASQFKKCAEIFFYRRINEHKDLISEEMKSFLIDRWTGKESQASPSSFHIVTMLLRDQISEEELQVELLEAQNERSNPEVFSISNQIFPPLGRVTAADLKFYCNLKDVQGEEIQSDLKGDVELSIGLFSKLLVDTDLFSVHFRNEGCGTVRTIFNDPLPLKCASIEESLEDLVRNKLLMSLEWNVIDQLVRTKEAAEYKIETVESFLSKIHSKMKTSVKPHQLWKLRGKNQSYDVLVQHPDSFYFRQVDGTLVPANVSIKLEFQIKFGAEKMTRGELLKEWCQLKFNNGSLTLRYRVDVETFTILSITQVCLEDVETELIKSHDTSPNKLIGNLFNLFGCLRRLPQANYKLQGKIESGCKKLLIYKSNENGSCTTDEEPWDIESVSTRKWIAIDELTPTFLNINFQFAPCCFPHLPVKTQSYLPKPVVAKKSNAAGMKRKLDNKKPSKATKSPKPNKKNLPKSPKTTPPKSPKATPPKPNVKRALRNQKKKAKQRIMKKRKVNKN